MDVKKSVGLLVLLLLISSSVIAVNETTYCSSFWGSISCFFFGSSENRAGKSWFDRGVVGEAASMADRKKELYDRDSALEYQGYLTATGRTASPISFTLFNQYTRTFPVQKAQWGILETARTIYPNGDLSVSSSGTMLQGDTSGMTYTITTPNNQKITITDSEYRTGDLNSLIQQKSNSIPSTDGGVISSTPSSTAAPVTPAPAIPASEPVAPKTNIPSSGSSSGSSSNNPILINVGDRFTPRQGNTWYATPGGTPFQITSTAPGSSVPVTITSINGNEIFGQRSTGDKLPLVTTAGSTTGGLLNVEYDSRVTAPGTLIIQPVPLPTGRDYISSSEGISPAGKINNIYAVTFSDDYYPVTNSDQKIMGFYKKSGTDSVLYDEKGSRIGFYDSENNVYYDSNKDAPDVRLGQIDGVNGFFVGNAEQRRFLSRDLNLDESDINARELVSDPAENSELRARSISVDGDYGLSVEDEYIAVSGDDVDRMGESDDFEWIETEPGTGVPPEIPARDSVIGLDDRSTSSSYAGQVIRRKLTDVEKSSVPDEVQSDLDQYGSGEDDDGNSYIIAGTSVYKITPDRRNYQLEGDNWKQIQRKGQLTDFQRETLSDLSDEQVGTLQTSSVLSVSVGESGGVYWFNDNGQLHHTNALGNTYAIDAEGDQQLVTSREIERSYDSATGTATYNGETIYYDAENDLVENDNFFGTDVDSDVAAEFRRVRDNRAVVATPPTAAPAPAAQPSTATAPAPAQPATPPTEVFEDGVGLPADQKLSYTGQEGYDYYAVNRNGQVFIEKRGSNGALAATYTKEGENWVYKEGEISTPMGADFQTAAAAAETALKAKPAATTPATPAAQAKPAETPSQAAQRIITEQTKKYQAAQQGITTLEKQIEDQKARYDAAIKAGNTDEALKLKSSIDAQQKELDKKTKDLEKTQEDILKEAAKIDDNPALSEQDKDNLAQIYRDQHKAAVQRETVTKEAYNSHDKQSKAVKQEVGDFKPDSDLAAIKERLKAAGVSEDDLKGVKNEATLKALQTKLDQETKALQTKSETATQDLAASNARMAVAGEALGTKWMGGSKLNYALIFITQTPRYPALSNAIFGDMGGYKASVERFFADKYLGGYVESRICDRKFDITEPGTGVAMMEVAPGVFQFVGSIQAERSPNANYPLSCDDSEETPLPCPNDLLCKSGLCFKDEKATTPEMGYFYKISWSVTAPTNVDFIKRTNLERDEVDFNIQLDDKWLFKPSDGSAPNANTNHLGVGNSSRQLPNLPPVIVGYLPTEYNKACIVFGDNKPADMRGDNPNPICGNFIVSNSASVNFDEGVTSDGADASATSVSGQFCGLEGC